MLKRFIMMCLLVGSSNVNAAVDTTDPLPMVTNSVQSPADTTTAVTTTPAPTNPDVVPQSQGVAQRIYERRFKQEIEKVYKRIFTSLENNGYFVLFEPNLGRNLAHFEQRWGSDYNKNKFEEIRSMVICNAWYANKFSNLDPRLLALCPLRITLTYKEGETTVLFVRPGSVALGSPAEGVATELEQDLIRIIEGVGD